MLPQLILRELHVSAEYLESAAPLWDGEKCHVSANVVDTSEVAEVCVLGSVVPGVTVSTVDCVLDGTTKAADGNETDIDEEASVVTAAASATTLGSAIVLEAAVGVEVVTVADIGVIVMLNAGCEKRFEAGCAVLERLELDYAWVPVGETNEKNAPLENSAPNTTEAQLGVEECGEGIGMNGRKPTLELDSWDCCIEVGWGLASLTRRWTTERHLRHCVCAGSARSKPRVVPRLGASRIGG